MDQKNDDIACITSGNSLAALNFKKKDGYIGTQNNIDECKKMVANNVDLCATEAGKDRCSYVAVDDSGQCWAISSSALKALPPNQLKFYPNLDGTCSKTVYKTDTIDEGDHVINRIINKYKHDIALNAQTNQDITEQLKKKKIILEYLYSLTDDERTKQYGGKSMNDIITELEQEQKNKELATNIQKTIEETNAMIDNLYIINTAKESIKNNNNISNNLITNQTNINNKINNDLNKINWSLKEVNRQEYIQNKLASLLGIIIFIFIFLSIFMFIYYMTDVNITAVLPKMDTITSIFTANKQGKINKPIKQSAAQSVLSNIFK